MSSNNHIIHPLVHHGTGQTERLLEALIPDNFQIDGRSMQDLIVAAYRYAGLLHYYNEDNQVEGDWRCFWEVETLTFLAVLAELDTEVILQQFNALEIGFAEDIDEGAGGPFDPGGENITNYYDQAQFIYQLALQVQKAYNDLPDSLALKREIAAMIDKRAAFDGENLVDALRQLISIHKEAFSDEHGEALPYTDYEPFFGPIWGLPDSDAFDVIRFQAAFTREEMRALFRRFYEVLVKIRQRAQYWFDQLISEPRLHQPHVALFLSFLRLFRHAQDSLNALTGRHLDYYYEKILCLARRPAVPDDVYLVFELAKGFEESLIEKGTAFLAGKDKNGRPLLFEALENWVVRSAQVMEIKNTHFDLCGFQGTGKILASPDVNVAYENGEILPNEKPASWRAVGDDADLPPGEIGFAIASPQLILREGKRVVDVVINLASDINGLLAEQFKVALSSEEVWIEPDRKDNFTFTPSDKLIPLERAAYGIRFEDDTIWLRVILEKDDPPVDTLGEALAAEAQLSTDWPICKVWIADVGQPASIYEIAREFLIQEITITVDVEGIKENLIIQSDQGVFDGTQKVYPFGPAPEVNHRFYIGSTEVFQKALQSLKIKFDWIAAPDPFSEYYEAYNIGPYDIPNPKVRIEFIDRADDRDINITQVLRLSGGTDQGLDLKISQVNFDPFEGAIFEWIDNSVAPPQTIPITDAQSPEAGRYFIPFPPAIPLDTLQLNISKGDEDFEPLNIGVRESPNSPLAFSFELVMFPRNKKFDDYPGEIRGRVTDMNGNALSGVDINSGSSLDIFDNNGENYRIASGTLPSNIDFSKADYGTLAIPTSDYHIVDAVMFPADSNDLPLQVEKTPPTAVVNTSVTAKNVQGNILGQVILNGGSPENSPILASLTGNSTVSLEKTGYQDFEFPLEHGTVVEAILFPVQPPHISTPITPGVGDIEITIKDVNGIVVAQQDFIINNEPNPYTTGSDGKITLTPDAGETSMNIVIESNRYARFPSTGSISVSENTHLEIFLTPLTFKITNNPGPGADKVKGVVIDLSNNPVVGAEVTAFTVLIELSPVTTDGNGAFEIDGSGLDASLWRLRVTKGAERLHSPTGTVNNVRNKDVLLRLGQLRNSRPFVGVLKGAATQPNGSAIPGVLVTVEGQSIMTNSSGEYRLEGLPLNVDEVSFQHPWYEDYTVPITDDSDINVVLLPRQARRVFSGNITDVFGALLPGVTIGIQLGNQKFPLLTSTQDGFYRLPVPIGLPSGAIVYFEYAGFDTLEITLPLSADELPGGTSASQMDVRLYFGATQLLPLIDNNDRIEEEFDITINALILKRDVRTQNFDRYSPTLKRGFVRFTLNESDFMHRAYTRILTWYASAASRGVTIDGTDLGNNLPVMPNPPYTPATNSISLSYVSTQSILIENGGIDIYYHLLPFNGHKEINLAEGPEILLLCPYYPSDRMNGFATGNLYLGVEKLRPGTNLPLLFQIEEGSERKAEWQPPQLVWSYLAKNNSWTAFESTDFLLDTTHGLTRSGLVQLKIPKTAVAENTMLNPALHWIRIAAVERLGEDIPVSVRALPNLVSVRTQAIQARFANHQNDLAHLGEPLAAGTIAKLEISRTAVKKVEQPFDSFGGRLPEQGNEFYRRISERLRHRDRAITLWDYERLLLEQFPKVHRVKCLPHTRMIASTDNCSTPTEQNIEDIPPDLSVMAPGYVLLAVIPDLARRTATRQAEPRFSFGDLMEMEDYLRTKTNLFVAWERESPPWLCEPETIEDETKYLWVVNPKYEPIRLSFKVAFLPGFDETYFTFQLDRELKNYLAPWIEDPAAEITFGQTLYQSRIIAFIESREYVDAIADFALYKAPAAYLLDSLPEDCRVLSDKVVPATPRSVLTTYIRADKGPDETDHDIIVANKTSWCLTRRTGRP